ncbi:MAG: histidine kinase dimerization/phospho-acceptor domain-containing protein [Desulfobacteraceae bacterium]
MNRKSKDEYLDFKGIGYSKIGFFKETRSKIKELESLNIELARRHSKLEAVFNSMGEGLTILDRNLSIVFVNQVQKDNFPNTAMIGKQCHQIFFKKATACKNCPVVQTMQNHKNLTGEIYIEETGNSGHYYEWTTSPVRDPSGYIYEVILLMRDITQKKEYEQKIIQTDRMAATGFLAAGVAHEINNPLTSIAGFSEALLKRLKQLKGDPDLQQLTAFEEYLEIINTEAYRCKDIIYNLQEFSRDASDDFEILSIDAIIRDTLSLFKQRAKDHNIRICYDAHLSPEKDVIRGKKLQLKHLILNLLIRSFKSAEMEGNLSIQSSSDGRHVRITLPDIERKMGQQNSNWTTKRINDISSWSSDVDLSICYNIVQHHMGVLKFEMLEEFGSVLAIYFPIAVVPACSD